jgi:hypothetical protein
MNSGVAWVDAMMTGLMPAGGWKASKACMSAMALPMASPARYAMATSAAHA